MAKFYRHGDLSFRRVNVEMGGKPVKKLVLAEGEHTGHFHQLEAFEGATIYSTPFQEAEGVPTRYVKIVGGGALLTHQEHNTIEIEEGDYEVRIEREYDYFLESIKTVID